MKIENCPCPHCGAMCAIVATYELIEPIEFRSDAAESED